MKLIEMESDDIESIFDVGLFKLYRIKIRKFNDTNYGFFNKTRKLIRFALRKITFNHYPKKNY